MTDTPPDYAARAARADHLMGYVTSKRTCDGCDLCCTAMGVEEIEKKPAVRCSHLCGEPGRSCSIYNTRPIACREFLCCWRGSDTLLAQNLFPARVGFVIALTNDFRQFPLLFTVHPDPAFPDAWKAPRHRVVFKKLAHDFNAIVVVGQHHLARHVFAPKGAEYSRAQHPQFFEDDGGRIGVPEHDFFEWRLTLQEVCDRLWSVGHVRGMG